MSPENARAALGHQRLWTGLSVLFVAVSLWLFVKPVDFDDDWVSWLRWLGRSDKLLHVLVFAAFGAWFCAVLPRSQWWKIALSLLLYGILIEVLQEATRLGRSGDWRDIVANALGISIGVLLAHFGGRDLIAAIDRWLTLRVPGLR